MKSLAIRRTGVRLLPDPGRVITKPYLPGEHIFPNGQSRVEMILERVLGLDEEAVSATLAATLEAFGDRHRDLASALDQGFQQVAGHVPNPELVTPKRRTLIGAYFTHEYAVEAAALNNPSIVAAPDQDGLGPGELRFILSLRAIGEGHISSIEFRTGVLGPDGDPKLDEPRSRPAKGRRIPAVYDKGFFTSRLTELGSLNEISGPILDALPHEFTIDEVEAAIREVDGLGMARSIAFETIKTIHWLASSNYALEFEPGIDLSERVIFPAGPTESRGMEDARFVRFTDEDGSVVYFATYTAFDGFEILPQLIETTDFLSFRIRTLGGIRARNKGIALFPRRIGGRFAALSRYDNENLYVMFSDTVRFWDDADRLHLPKRPWELIQIGNCGSPIETEAGWLVITHGVGPMRRYALGAILLDRDDPRKVIGHLDEPMLAPDKDERDGYVPNVVYSCGSLIHGGRVIVPYGYSDYAAGIATLSLDDLLGLLAG